MDENLEVFNSLAKKLLNEERKEPVADFISSDKLYDKLDLTLNDDPVNEEYFNNALEKLVLSTPRTATNAFFNQLFGGRNEKAVLGDLLAVLLNNSMYTYKAAGPMIGVEKTIMRKVCDMIGWDEKSDGTIAPGGSMTNYMSMVMGRDRFNDQIRCEGVQQKLTVYTSSDSHYSIPKNASFSGVGRNNVRFIATDKKGKMIVEELHLKIKEDMSNGFHPILVNATAGTTVLGAFDDITPISEVCNKYNIWLHVDGAYCGAVLFSEKYKALIKGIENADSFSFNAHKMLSTPLSCSLIVVKDKQNLSKSFSNDASYLYQTDHDEFNLGKISLQCGRRNDSLKFWTLWKSIGTKGLEEIVNHQFYLADVAREYILSKPNDYKLYSFSNSVSICFNYKGISAEALCTKLYEHSEIMVGYGSFRNETFIRLVAINAQNEKDDILSFFATIEKFVFDNKEVF